jgi:hypothetical protein
MTVLEWRQLGIKLFGVEEDEWRFVCPGCGHVQAIKDFRPYATQGATPDSARQECIGRYTGGRSWLFDGGPGPCDYAGYGLFGLSPVVVVKPDGKEVQCFHFDDGVYRVEPTPKPAPKRKWRLVVSLPGDPEYEVYEYAPTRGRARHQLACLIKDCSDFSFKELYPMIRVYAVKGLVIAEKTGWKEV